MIFNLEANVRWDCIIGGGDGFGAAIVDRFHQEKCKVIFIDINEAKGAAKAKANPGLVFVKGDVSKHETWENVLDLAITQYGRLDIVVNNAGKWRHAYHQGI